MDASEQMRQLIKELPGIRRVERKGPKRLLVIPEDEMQPGEEEAHVDQWLARLDGWLIRTGLRGQGFVWEDGTLSIKFS